MSAELPKIPEPVYIFWSADTLHIRLWTADPERAARFAADTGATATVYVPKQEVQEATRQAMERAIEAVEFEKVEADETKHHHDYLYNAALDHAKDGIRRALLPQSEKRHG